ncbi:hypothetical protein RMSM_02617 [Rhodopirellula maiorica SM1]|uniref:Protein BatD n=1 Tax=Rhodopirellula maiorica SM1 TaxID=1265738 RepID=M5RYG8_9BACT|nr:hypothetical protein RMSM_02617 [Rhodopirellula maiorica SM1]
MFAAALIVGLTRIDAAEQDHAVDVNASVDRNDALLLDPIKLTVTVTAPVDAEIEFPPTPETIGPFDVVSVDDMPSVPVLDDADSATRRWTRRMTLETLAVGEQTIPAIEIRYVLRDAATAESGLLRTKPIPIQINSVLSSDDTPKAFRQMKPSLPIEPEAKATPVHWGMIASALVAFALLAIAMKRRRKRTVTPKQWASRRVAALELRQQANEIDNRSAYLELAEIARDYVIAREGLNPSVMTTDEVTRYVTSKSSLPSETQKRLVAWLVDAEQTKFAPPQFASTEMTRKVQEAKSFVHELLERLPASNNSPASDKSRSKEDV